MKIVQPTLLKHQPIKYFDAFFSKKYKSYIPKVLFRVLRRYMFEEKNNQSYIFDYLICGVNPVFNILLLINILKESKEGITIGIYINDMLEDYYAYDIVLKEMQLQFNLNDSLAQLSSLLKEKKVNLIVLNDNVLFPYDCKKEEDFFMMKLCVPERVKKNSQNTYIDYNNKLKKELQKKYNDVIYKMSKKIKWNIENIHKDNLPTLFIKQLYLTSLPQGWLEIINEKEIHNSREKVVLKHELLSYSFGSAKEINLGMEPRLIKKSIENDLISLRI